MSAFNHKDDGISRRAALKGAGAAAIMATAGTMLPRPSRAATKGGHLRIGFDGASTTDTLNPEANTSDHQILVGFQWGNLLVEMDEKNQPIPELAESWGSNSNATSWVFKLRKGVTFHNGKEMTAADVVHTLNYHRREESKSGAKVLLAEMTDIKASDKHEVTITLANPNADAPYILGDLHLLIMPEGGDPALGIGTGPYVIKEFKPGIRTLAARNENYWKTGRAHVDSVETIVLNDSVARIAALRSGQVDIVNRCDPRIVSDLEKVEGLKVLRVPGPGHYTFPMRCDTAPFDNKDLRLALKYAIDREELLDKILFGYGRVGNDQPVPSFDPMYAEDIEQRSYDPDKAKYHLKKSGVDGPVQLSIADAAFPRAVDAATLFQEQARKAGLNLEVNRVPDDSYWSDVWMKKPFVGSYWYGKPTADLVLSIAYASTASWNETFWRRPDFDKILVEARGELDQTKRKELYRELQLMIWDDGGEIIPVFNDTLMGMRAGIAGFVPTPTLCGYRIAEQLYFES